MSATAESPGLHLGVTPWRADRSGDADLLAAQGERAERLGVDSFWLPESHFVERNPSPAPLLQLAAVAARTSRLSVATTSFLLPVRHPILVAEEVAVLDRLSRGRLVLGVGRGFRAALFRAFGVQRAQKRRRLEDVLEVMLAAWRGEPVAWEEEGEERTPVTLCPLPLQRPHPPLWMAAFGPKGLEQAGRLALPYLASPVEPLARLEANYQLHRRSLPTGVDPDLLPVPIMRTVFVSRDREVLRLVREGLARQAAALARSALGTLRAAASAPLQDWALVGTPEEVGEGLLRYHKALGVTHLVARGQIPDAPPAAVEESLELLVDVRRQLRLA